jgi:ribosomal subunit interface protein
MQLTITGKQVEIGEALRRRVEASLATILEKYFKTAIEAHVVLTREAHLFRSEVSLHIGRGIIVNARASAADVAAAFDAAAERIAKQLRRYKRRLRSHHARTREGVEANQPALEPAGYDADRGRDPVLSSGARHG